MVLAEGGGDPCGGNVVYGGGAGVVVAAGRLPGMVRGMTRRRSEVSGRLCPVRPCGGAARLAAGVVRSGVWFADVEPKSGVSSRAVGCTECPAVEMLVTDGGDTLAGSSFWERIVGFRRDWERVASEGSSRASWTRSPERSRPWVRSAWEYLGRSEE